MYDFCYYFVIISDIALDICIMLLNSRKTSLVTQERALFLYE